MATLATLQELFRHELLVALRTRRAVAICLLYLAIAALTALGFAFALRAIESHPLGMLLETSSQSLKVDIQGGGADQSWISGLVAWFAGVEPEQLAASLQSSLVLPLFLGVSLFFLPLLIVFSSFDVLAADLQSRSLCYQTLRTHRWEVVVSKVVSQSALAVGVVALSLAGWVAVSEIVVDSFSSIDALSGIGRILVIAVPYSFCYVCMTALCSSLSRQPFMALLLALGMGLGLRTLSWIDIAADAGILANVRWAHWLSPSAYTPGLWRDALTTFASSLVAYGVFGTVFCAAAVLVLARREL